MCKINDIIQDARRKREQKYGGDYSEQIKIKFIGKFLEKINNRKKYNKKNEKITYSISKKLWTK